MSEPLTGTLLHAGPEGIAAGGLAGALAEGLRQPVALCPPGDPTAAVVSGVRTLVAAGARRLVILPLGLSALQNEPGVTDAIRWASRRWPFLTFHAAKPLTWLEWAAALKAVAVETSSLSGDELENAPKSSSVLLVGQRNTNPLVNADLGRLAHLVGEGGDFGRVDYAFVDGRPDVATALQLSNLLGLQEMILVPWLLGAEQSQRLANQVDQAVPKYLAHGVVAASPLTHPALIDILAARHQAALADNSFLAPTWADIQAELARTLGPAAHSSDQRITAEEEAQLRELDRKINELLPPQYQGRYEEVRPESMGTGPMKFGADGTVAWDEMWTSFCDLALAGGPPHRGSLLEAVPATDALAEPDKYQAVVAEIERGIRLVTGLPVVPSRVAGWVGVRCDSEAMAIWVMRAIIVENVMVRREGDVLYVPAGPRFTLKREIKNVVTVLAKTCHYWTAHLVSR